MGMPLALIFCPISLMCISVAFSAYGTTYPLGAIIGPIIGGALARPANRFSLFHTRFWKAYPYFLPCLVASCITGVTIIVGMGILKEVSILSSVHDLETCCSKVLTNAILRRCLPIVAKRRKKIHALKLYQSHLPTLENLSYPTLHCANSLSLDSSSHLLKCPSRLSLHYFVILPWRAEVLAIL
jgi:MFS family permease